VEENSVKYVPLDSFFGVQILPNSISTGALGELTTLPQTSGLVGWGGRHPLPISLNAFGVSPTVPHHFSKPSATPDQKKCTATQKLKLGLVA